MLSEVDVSINFFQPNVKDLISSKEEGKIFTTSTASSSVRPH
jgi:hypothetical protein